MTSPWWTRPLAVLAVLTLSVSVLQAALSGDDGPPAATRSLAGQLLVASPSIGDPNFSHTVVLVVRHDGNGAFGIVINQPLGERTLASLLAAVGEPDDGATLRVPVYSGGPVEPDKGFILHSTDYHAAETVGIDDGIAMTATARILHDLAKPNAPRKSLVAFGYTGWGPGQLDGEMARDAWFVAKPDPALVFDEDRDRVWERALARRIQDL